jgi:vesicle-fusing ATPase
MGTCAILEILLLPFGKDCDGHPGTSAASFASSSSTTSSRTMTVRHLPWPPGEMFAFRPENEEGSGTINTDADAAWDDARMLLSGAQRNRAYIRDFSARVGGLAPQIETIVRRVLDGRVIRPVDGTHRGQPAPSPAHANGDAPPLPSEPQATAQQEAEVLSALGLTPVRGLLLHGPPGTGKTLLAREISQALRARAPKIVAAPELLDRWVGGSEKAVRALFADAEAELASCDGDPTRSALHVVVIDEIDAVFRHRSGTSSSSSSGGASDSGEATRSSVVNQILAKLDGVNAIPNVLLIGMTNRRELIDSALLRPGRLEVQIEIPLPTLEGRREILQIHFGPLRRQGRLSDPLCRAIDGSSAHAENGSTRSSSFTGRRRDRILRSVKNAGNRFFSQRGSQRYYYDYDLAAATPGFSGADLAGLVRCAGSIALSRSRSEGSGVAGLFVTLDDVQQALEEVKNS